MQLTPTLNSQQNLLLLAPRVHLQQHIPALPYITPSHSPPPPSYLLQVKVALVTRNTTASVEAFFSLVGPEWRALFSEVRTREFAYVKPDKRLLLDVAQVGHWEGVQGAGG